MVNWTYWLMVAIKLGFCFIYNYCHQSVHKNPHYLIRRFFAGIKPSHFTRKYKNLYDNFRPWICSWAYKRLSDLASLSSPSRLQKYLLEINVPLLNNGWDEQVEKKCCFLLRILTCMSVSSIRKTVSSDF